MIRNIALEVRGGGNKEEKIVLDGYHVGGGDRINLIEHLIALRLTS